MKRFGVRDLAKLANVSIGTVDRALNQREGISPETRQRIMAIAREKGYVPNLTARALSFSRSSLKIGLCIPREPDYFYGQIHAGVTDEALRYTHVGLEVVYRPVKKLSSPAVSTIRQLLASGIDALILTVGSAEDLTPLIKEAEKERNVRVVCVASDTFSMHRSSSVCVDGELSGSIAAELMARVVPPGSEVAVVTGKLTLANHQKKVSSFQKSFPFECPGGKMIEVIQGQSDEQKVFRETVRLLQQHKQLAGIYVSTAICVPVCEALESVGRAGKVKLISTDLFTKMAPFFANSTIFSSIYQNPYRQSQTAVRLILDHFLNGEAFPSMHYIDPVIALRSNLKLFREMQTSPNTSSV